MENDIWNTELPADVEINDYPVADPGTYDFEVLSVDGKEYKPSSTSKIGRCAELNIKLRVEAKVKGVDKDVTVFDRIYSDPKTIWKMSAFAKAVGIFKTGMTPNDLLHDADGCIGKVKIGVKQYKGENQNEVKAYIIPEEKKVDPSDLPF